ncbi:MAG: hypothetical protein KGH57_03165 [Candidatus Micrarchaeota archaeon]|nr:hypothetical protein [Candidatus Micrarchaeota archaeon]
MIDELLSTRDIGSGPRDPAVLGLLRQGDLTAEQMERARGFIEKVEALPKSAYGASVRSESSLVPEYFALAKQPFSQKLEAATDFVTKLGVLTLHNLGFARSWNLEWTRTEMVEWERADVGGTNKSDHWQHSYGFRFWKDAEIVQQISYSGKSERHVKEVARVRKFAKEKVRVPLTDPHCVIHATSNLFYYGLELSRGRDETLAGLIGDHKAGLDFARKVTKNRIKSISESSPQGVVTDIQLDNFIVACERKEFSKDFIRAMGLKAPSYIELMKESTPSYPNIEYSNHNCLQPYHFYVPYVAAELKSITRFHYEVSTHDTNKRGLTADQRTGQGWEAIRQLKQYGLRKHQKAIIDVASTYEGAQPPDPEVVRDRILYPILRLDYAPEQIEVAPACGQRNLSLERMLEIDVNIHRGRDLALKQLERDFRIDAAPHLTKSYLSRVKG